MSTDTHPPLSGMLDTVMEVHRAEGYDAGYRRAVNDLMADFVLIAAEFVRDQQDADDQLRKHLRDFQQRFEQHLEQASATSRPTEQYVDGGLGI